MEIKILNIFDADLVGLYNIARAGENSPRLIENLKLKVSPKSLIGIGSSSSLLSRVDSSDYQICYFDTSGSQNEYLIGFES